MEAACRGPVTTASRSCAVAFNLYTSTAEAEAVFAHVVCAVLQVYGREHHAEPVSYRQIIQQISHHRGFRGFYVGILPEYCKVVPGVAIAFCTYEQLKKWLQAQ